MELKVTVPKEEKTPKAELHLGHVRMARKKLVDLIPADYNPRVMSQAARAGLEASVESFGLVQPIVLNERTGVVVSGHQRLNALFAKGATETDVVLVDLDPIREKALNVTMNNKHIEGDFDESKLADLLSEIQLSEPDLMGLVQLDTLVLPDWSSAEIPEGANKDLTKSQIMKRIHVSFPQEAEFLLPEVYSGIERLLKESFDGHGIRIS